VENGSLVNRMQNQSRSVFLALLDIFLMQSDLRQSNSRLKRQKGRQTSETLESKETSEISVDLDISQTAHLSFGMHHFIKLIVDIFPAVQTHEFPSTHTTPGPSIVPALNTTTTTTTVKVKSERGKSFKRVSCPSESRFSWRSKSLGVQRKG
jgi:hypothetical protein